MRSLLKKPISKGFIRSPVQTKVYPYYVYYYMQAIYGKFTAIGDGNFKMASKAFVSDLDILKPSLEKQDEFASFVEQADKLWFI